MEWQEPKTDWKVEFDTAGSYIGDYFNATDYQRIKNNLLYLKNLAETMYRIISFPSIPDVTAASFGYASTIDALERALDALADGTFDPGIQERKHWEANAPAPSAEDLNRIESSCMQMFGTLSGQAKCLPHLSFILGGAEIG